MMLEQRKTADGSLIWEIKLFQTVLLSGVSVPWFNDVQQAIDGICLVDLEFGGHYNHFSPAHYHNSPRIVANLAMPVSVFSSGDVLVLFTTPN